MFANIAGFLSELKRRKVYRAAAVYVVAGLGILAAAEAILDPLHLGATRPVVVVLVLAGFPIILVAAWAYELRPEGEETANRLPAKGASRPSIVVLPFANLSPSPDEAYFSDGLTEEIITSLAYLRSLRVISHSTAVVLRGTGKDVRTIGRELGVDYVLEGSVRKAGDKLRVTVQLIDATNDEHLWADRHDGNMGDVFDVQERIAKQVAAALRLRLSPLEERRLEERPIENPKAYDTWILAMHEGRKLTAAGVDRGIQLAQDAQSVVGPNARLYASLAYLYWAAYDSGVHHEDRTLDRADEAAGRALELEPTLPLALYARGLVRYKRGDIPGFVRYTGAAADVGGDSDSLGMLGAVLAEVGKVDEGRRYADASIDVSPLTFFPWFFRSLVDLFDCRAEDAYIRIRDARNRLAAGEPFAGWWVAQMAAFAGREEDAQKEFDDVARMDGGMWSEFSRLFGCALSADTAAVNRQLEGSRVADVAKTDELYPIIIASALARVGDNVGALDWLERAIGWGFTNDRFLLDGNRFFAPLKREPRFDALIARAREKRMAFIA